MNGKTHVLIGFTVGVGLAYLDTASPLTALVMAVTGGAAALLPDIDHPNSKISHKIRPARLLFMWFGHRGFTHSILALAAVGLLAGGLLPLLYAEALVAGYGSHIIADMATIGGVRLLWPLRGFVSFPVTIITGGMGETLVRLCVGVTLLLELLAFAPKETLQWLLDHFPRMIV